MNSLTPLQQSFDKISPTLPKYTHYRAQRAIHTANKDPFYGNATEIFESSVNHLYRKHLTLEAPRVVVCTGIAHDGLGDLMHVVHASTILKNSPSSPHVTMICSMNSFQKRKFILTKQVLGAANECLFAESFNEDKKLQAKAQKAIDDAEVVVQMATGSLMTSLRGLSMDGIKHKLCFSELGLGPVQGLGFSPQDIGVPIPIDTQPTILDDADLTNLLLEHSNRPNYSFHLGYIKYYSLQNAFFTVCCLVAKAHDASVDIAMPMNSILSIGWTAVEDHEEFSWVLNQLGLKQISLYVRDKDNKLTCKQTRIFGETGLDVRIINPFPISLSSFAFLSSRSEFCTGCTGDFSFLGALLGKTPQIPFYEVLGHKLKFYQDFIELLKDLLPNTSPLLHFFQSLFTLRNNPPIQELFPIAQDIARAIQSPEIQEHIKNLSSLIKERFNFNEVLLDYVSREVAHTRYPTLQSIEQQLYNDFFADRGALHTVYAQLSTTLAQMTHLAVHSRYKVEEQLTAEKS